MAASGPNDTFFSDKIDAEHQVRQFAGDHPNRVVTVLRMAPVAIALVGAELNWRTVALIGWLGPRGLASIVFGILALDLLFEPDGGVVAGDIAGPNIPARNDMVDQGAVTPADERRRTGHRIVGGQGEPGLAQQGGRIGFHVSMIAN